MENYNKVFEVEAFINDSKENLQEFIKVLIMTPLFDIFIQNISYIVNSKYKETLKSQNLSENPINSQKNVNNKSPAILNKCDRMYEFFVKAIEKKKLKKSLKSLFKINITHNISLPQIALENLNYSQTSIFDNPLNEIKFTHSTSICLYKNHFNLPYANLQENPLTSSILHFKSKESLSNYILINSKNLSEDCFKYYKKNYEIFMKFFGFNSTKGEINQKSSNKTKQINTEDSKSIKLLKSIQLKDNYIDIVQKMIGGSEIITADNKNFLNDFNINVGVNVLQTVSLCEICKSPNTLWEIRKSKKKI